MIIKKDSEIVKAKVERKSIALNAKKESSDEECLTSGSEDEEYTMAYKSILIFITLIKLILSSPMSSPKNSLSKLSKKPKIYVRLVWRKKLNYCNSSNVNDVNTPTPMPKPPSPYNVPSKKNSPIETSNHASPQPHSPPIIDPYADVVLQVNQNHNKTQPQLPHSPTREMLIDDINQLQDLFNLLAMHLSNHTTNLTPPTPILPHTVIFDQVKHHVGYCPYYRYNQAQFLDIREDLNWVEFLLPRPQPPLQIQREYPPTTTSVTTSPPITN
nr:hypothetical protein [Tanacetum cinerariifolium]